MKTLLSILIGCAASLAAPSMQASSLLMIPRTGDPSVQPPETVLEGVDAFVMPSAFFGGEGVTGVTYVCWLKWDCGTSISGSYTGLSPFVNCSCSYEAARSSNSEGGEALPNLIDDAYLTDGLPLSSDGTWSSECLTAVGDLAPSTLPTWQYGCFAVNYRSDTAFTLSVGGAEKYCAASSTNVAFSIIATSSDRTVSIAAESTTANIAFGIAHNPLRQFIGGGSQNTKSGGSIESDYGGISSNEWRMVVFRARIDGGTNVVTQTKMMRPTAECSNVEDVTQSMWRPTDHFAKDSRVMCSVAYALSLQHDDGAERIHWYAPKARQCWMTDEQIELWRDKDYEEITRRGM